MFGPGGDIGPLEMARLDRRDDETSSVGYLNPEVKKAIDKAADRQEKLEKQLDHINNVIMSQDGAENLLKLAQAQDIIMQTKLKAR